MDLLILIKIFYLSCSHFLFSTISSSSFLPDVSHGEHDREAGELWRSKTGCTAQFTATLGSSTVQLPLTTTFALGRHSPQGKGALCLQVSACDAARFQSWILFCFMFLNHPYTSFSLPFCPLSPLGTAGKSSLVRQTSPDTCGHTQGSNPTGILLLLRSVYS